ncbi:GlcNAc-PI de-N-acetylase [Brevundimonas sp. LM2]|uniref:PIG-L family deacetylase n=1 Tax=Brevundimonas sp. LM2 TaxID=1938605 RepID=UPI000983A9C7|nr:PIG-L family deacetylase [Brevundimonas sp. LM2]AQR62862.1 GlcNAc-PI de-N-acetylase [Brevundimonas sp. LM2]
MVGARRLAATRWRAARWLVLAPHADDETLGAGALIAEAAAEGRLAGVAFLTDGTGSHPHPDPASRARLRAMRRAEARAACRLLTRGSGPDPLFLDWPDAGPFGPGSPEWRDTVRTLAALCRRARVDALAVTAVAEPHCDHAAAGRLAREVAQAALRPVAVFDYCVWGEAPPRVQPLTTGALTPGRRRAALAAHRSQLTPAFGDGFRLPPHQRVIPMRDRLYPRSQHDAS